MSLVMSSLGLENNNDPLLVQNNIKQRLPKGTNGQQVYCEIQSHFFLLFVNIYQFL